MDVSTSILSLVHIICDTLRTVKSDIDADSGGLKYQFPKYSLVHLMSKYSDFTNQKSDIEELASKFSCAHSYNSNILFTPKFYCKLAGEGIAYSWV